MEARCLKLLPAGGSQRSNLWDNGFIPGAREASIL